MLCSQPIVYTDQAGDPYESRVTITEQGLLDAGFTLPVLYDRANPTIVRPADPPAAGWYWLAGFIRAGIGVFLGAMGGFSLGLAASRVVNVPPYWGFGKPSDNGSNGDRSK